MPVTITTDFDDDTLYVYYLDCDWKGIHRKITLYLEMIYLEWSGAVDENGDWRYLTWFEIEQAKHFLAEKGIL